MNRITTYMPDGEYKTFLVSYRYEGAEWSVQLPARSYDDAKARLGRLIYANIDGELVITLPPYGGPLAALIAGLRNAIRRLVIAPDGDNQPTRASVRDRWR